MKTLARERSGRTSSMTGSGHRYLSLFKELLSCFGSRQSRRSPDSFVATTRLLTQSLGSSTGIKAPTSYSLSSVHSQSVLQSSSMRLIIINPLHSRVAHRSFDFVRYHLWRAWDRLRFPVTWFLLVGGFHLVNILLLRRWTHGLNLRF